MSTVQIAVDLAKPVLDVTLSAVPRQTEERGRLSRAGVGRYVVALPPVEILLEAFGAAHHCGRQLPQLGHQVTLLHPRYVARYRDGSKTGRADAKALLEAAPNQASSRVPVKSVEQQAVVAPYRLRQGFLQTRTARIKAVRGHLREFGCAILVGAHHVQLVGAARGGSVMARRENVPAGG